MKFDISNTPTMSGAGNETASIDMIPRLSRELFTEGAGARDVLLNDAERLVDAHLATQFGSEQVTVAAYTSQPQYLQGVAALRTSVEQPYKPANPVAPEMALANPADDNFLADEIPGARYTGRPSHRDELAIRKAERLVADTQQQQPTDVIQQDTATTADVVGMDGPDAHLTYLRTIEQGQSADDARATIESILGRAA